jgi:fructose-1,6-bisphosphatase/inositol monophosphatase family enzyme
VPRATPDIDAVTRLIQDVARDAVLPKFRALRADEIIEKPTDGSYVDLVTVADRDAEARLTDGLLDLFPAARVIGEEAAHASPELLSLLETDGPLWIVDPIDGTHNFALGFDAFGTMVAFADRGQVLAGWIYLPVREETFVAEAGSGAVLNGEPIRVPARESDDALRGTFFVRFMPEDLQARVLERSDDRFMPAAQAGAAAVEYTDVLRGAKDFDVYYRLLPWDHGAASLILNEGGGAVEHLDGTPYTLRSPSQLTIVAGSPDIAAQVRGWFTSDRLRGT